MALRPLLVFFLLFLASRSDGQVYNFRHYTVANGLPQSQVLDVLQDRNGYLWLATGGGGLCRFDGKDFTVYDTRHGLNNARVNCMLEDRRGRLWIGTGAGLCLLEGSKLSAFDEESGLSNDVVLSLCEDRLGQIWVGTMKRGIFVYDGERFRDIPVFTKEGRRVKDEFRTLASDSAGDVWMGSVHGLFRVHGDKIIHYSSSEGLPGNNTWELHVNRRGALWGGTFGDGIFLRRNEQFTHMIAGQQLNGKENIVALLEDRQGYTWAGSENAGLYRLMMRDGKIAEVTHFTERNGLPNNRIRSLFQDREGNIWIGTDGGLACFDGELFSFITDREGLNNKFVLSFFEDARHRLWVGSEGGVNIISGDTISEFRTPGGERIPQFAWSMTQDSRGNMWFGTYLGGAYRYDGKKLRQISSKNSAMSNDVIFDIVEDHRGNIWLGSDYGAFILHHNDDSIRTFNNRNGLRSHHIRSLYRDKENTIWIGTRGGGLMSCHYKNGLPAEENFVNLQLGELIDKGNIYALTGDNEGNIWFGVYDLGLVRYTPATGELRTITTAEGLIDNSVLSLTMQGNHLWIGTIKGVSRFDRKAYNGSGKIVMRSYGKAEGFKPIECNQHAAFNDSRGNVWFGTVSGVVRCKPGAEQRNALAPPVYLTGLRLFFEQPDWSAFTDSIDPGTHLPARLTLPYDQNHLTFYFTGICFTVSEKVRYRYRLEGLDNQWSPASPENRASYPGIPPGTYTFMVEACNNEGIWCKTPVTFRFTIEPPFWSTLWFYALCAAGAIGIVFTYIAFRTRNLRAAKTQLEEQVRFRTRELEKQKQIIEEKNKDITDSISYAQRIQRALLASGKLLQKSLQDHFILYKPKAIVSGDFYWSSDSGGKLFVIAADCTGHGVPGAFMSLLCISFVNEAITEKNIQRPDLVFNHVRERLIQSLSAEDFGEEAHDGMDGSLCVFDREKMTLQFACANNPLWLIRKGELLEFRPDKMPVGRHHGESQNFSLQEIQLQKGDAVYLLTDGYADQFGGPQGKKFKYRQLQEKLLERHLLPMKEQRAQMEQIFEDWKGELDQVDDVLLIGLRV